MRLLSICPRIKKEGGCVIAATAWRVRILLLGTLFRRVIVDPREKKIRIRSRYLWFFKKNRTFAFKHILALTYGYQDLSPDQFISFGHQSIDWFTVGIRVGDREETELTLFNFVGDGLFENNGPLPDWLYFEERLFDLAGQQQKTSRIFVEVLGKIMKKKVVPPRP